MAQISSLEQLPAAKPHAHVWTGGPRAGKQLRSPYRERTIDALIELDGPYCRAEKCHLRRDFGSQEALVDKAFRYALFTVNHLGQGPLAHWLDNEVVTHWVCNNREDKQHAKRHSSHKERERDSGAGAQQLPAEIDLNVRLYPRYERWLSENVPCPVDEAIFRATREIWKEKGHGAHQTLRGYLSSLTVGDDAPFWIDADSKTVHRNSRRAQK